MADYDDKLLDGDGLEYYLSVTDADFVKPDDVYDVPENLDFDNVIVFWGDLDDRRTSLPQSTSIGVGTWVVRIKSNGTQDIWRVATAVETSVGNFTYTPTGSSTTTTVYYTSFVLGDENDNYSLTLLKYYNDSSHTVLVKAAPWAYGDDYFTYPGGSAAYAVAYSTYNKHGLRYNYQWSDGLNDSNSTGFQDEYGVSPTGHPIFTYV